MSIANLYEFNPLYQSVKCTRQVKIFNCWFFFFWFYFFPKLVEIQICITTIIFGFSIKQNINERKCLFSTGNKWHIKMFIFSFHFLMFETHFHLDSTWKIDSSTSLQHRMVYAYSVYDLKLALTSMRPHGCCSLVHLFCMRVYPLCRLGLRTSLTEHPVRSCWCMDINKT